MKKLALSAILAGTLVSSIVAADMNKCGALGSTEGHLTDKNGMTLYTFDKDKPYVSNCGEANECLAKWPVFYVKLQEIKFNSPKIDNMDFATILRNDGMLQTTYKGKPLYYFFKDEEPGQTRGDMVKNVWHIVKPGM